jgi:Ca-activated chloride channel family protein
VATFARRSAGASFNTEAYDKIDDNTWTAVAAKPLSTFSTDVDTASYANIRRFLNTGSLPPKDAVRIEEMINYFSYDYPQPKGDAPFSVTTTIGECPWNPRHQLALIGLQARRIDRSQTPPRNLVFLVDVSGSMMTPNKLPLVKSSLAMLARNLTDNDRIALVVYAGAAGVVLPSTRGGDPTTILDALARLEAGGSTNGAQGLELAYQTAQQHFIKGGVNRVVLATDGDFNVGVTNQGDLIRMIEKNRESGVTLSVLGYGMGNTKDSTMEKLADRGNGNYSYIDSLSEAQKVLVDEAGGTLVTVAKDVKLQIEFNPRVVAAYRLIGYENRLLNDRDFNDDKKDAGDMGAGHSVTALYELLPAGEKMDLPGVDPLKYQEASKLTPAAAGSEAMTVKLRYKKPDGDVSSLMSVAVRTGSRTTAELGFASAVAEFGMLLRDSEFKGSSSFADVLSRAKTYRGEDPFGHRAEFMRLVNMAENLSRASRRD